MEEEGVAASLPFLPPRPRSVPGLPPLLVHASKEKEEGQWECGRGK